MGDSSLLQLKNLGLRSCHWLQEVGIENSEDLRAAGAIEAFLKVRQAGFHPSLNLLYALEGALQDCHWSKLNKQRRAELLHTIDHQEQRSA